MAKLHLPAVAPSLGALLLVRHLTRRDDMAEAIAAIDARTGPGMVQRIVLGEVVPASGIDIAVAEVTNGAVPSRSWRRPAGGWWFAPMGAPRSPAPRGRLAMLRAPRAMPRPRKGR